MKRALEAMAKEPCKSAAGGLEARTRLLEMWNMGMIHDGDLGYKIEKNHTVTVPFAGTAPLTGITINSPVFDDGIIDVAQNPKKPKISNPVNVYEGHQHRLQQEGRPTFGSFAQFQAFVLIHEMYHVLVSAAEPSSDWEDAVVSACFESAPPQGN